MLVTVFTPTYNRAYILEHLYQSLCLQTCKDFEWLIVDDGSTDNTEDLVNAWLSGNSFSIRYIRQKNGGKHRAINNGIQSAKGELFYIVDSDDQLPPNAIGDIIKVYSDIKDDSEFAGVCGLKYYFDGVKVGDSFTHEVLDCSMLDFRYVHKMKGDMAEVFKTEVLKCFPFPEFEGEKFCPEAVVWNRIGCKYKMRYFNKDIYHCDYLPDGLTAKIVQIRMKSPQTTMLCYSELCKMRVPFSIKVKSAVNFWRFAFCSKESFKTKVKMVGAMTFPLMFLGLAMHLKDKMKF